MIIEALIAGEDSAAGVALADARIRSPQHKLRDALSGRIRRHHRFMLNLHLQQINTDAAITEIDREVDANLAPFRTGVEPRLQSLASARSVRRSSYRRSAPT